MQRTALSHWNDRIAPVFDVSTQILLLGDTENQDSEHPLRTQPLHKATDLATLGVTTLICGAISRPVHELLLAQGIQVIAFIAGDLRTIVDAWKKGQLGPRFAMPGCRQRQRRNGWPREKFPKGSPGNQISVQGQNQLASGCTCPACGYRQLHVCGTPCQKIICPHCGQTLIRS